MKIRLYYDYRFLLPVEDHDSPRKDIQGYVPAYGGEHCLRFVRIVSLPCLPVKGQKYHLAFDPVCQVRSDDDDTSFIVRESGFFEEEDGQRAFPYFVISFDRLFSEESRCHEIEKKSLEAQEAWWFAEAKSCGERLTPIFKENGWEVEWPIGE
jgi:hypothetical protein